jgi:hypothetical protein
MEPFAPWRLWTQLFVVSFAVLYFLIRGSDFLRIVAVCIVTLVAYGIAQDQFTARMSPEYFTIAHPPIEGLTDPTLLGITWGFLGSWWGGFFLGLALAATSTLGSNPPLPLRDLRWPLAALVLFIAFVSATCGLCAELNGRAFDIAIEENLRSQLADPHPRTIFVVGCIHMGAYLSAISGSIVVCLWAAWLRHQRKSSAVSGEKSLP